MPGGKIEKLIKSINQYAQSCTIASPIGDMKILDQIKKTYSTLQEAKKKEIADYLVARSQGFKSVEQGLEFRKNIIFYGLGGSVAGCAAGVASGYNPLWCCFFGGVGAAVGRAVYDQSENLAKPDVRFETAPFHRIRQELGLLKGLVAAGYGAAARLREEESFGQRLR